MDYLQNILFSMNQRTQQIKTDIRENESLSFSQECGLHEMRCDHSVIMSCFKHRSLLLKGTDVPFGGAVEWSAD